MKQKRTFIAILLVLAVLGLGIAFADMNVTELTAKGNATINPNDAAFDVKFTAGTVNEDSSKVSIDATGAVATLTFDAFTAGGQEQTAKLTITNASKEYLAKLAIKTQGTDSDNFTITEVLDTTTDLAADGATRELTITVKANKAVTTAVTEEVKVVLTATPVAPTTKA